MGSFTSVNAQNKKPFQINIGKALEGVASD